MAISLTETIQAILFHDLVDPADAASSPQPASGLSTTLQEHPEVLAFLHFAGYLKVRPDASIMIRTLADPSSGIEDVENITASIQEAIKGEADAYSVQIYRRLVTALKSFTWTHEPANAFTASDFDFNPINLKEISSLGQGASGSVVAASYLPLRHVIAFKKIAFRQRRSGAQVGPKKRIYYAD